MLTGERVNKHDCTEVLTELRVERNAVQLFAGQRDVKEVELRQEGEDMQPQLVRQKQPLGVLLISGCLGNKPYSLDRGQGGWKHTVMQLLRARETQTISLQTSVTSKSV